MGTNSQGVKSERFNTVQALRFLCFMVVFGVHADFIHAASTAIILEVFIGLSGFMMTYAYIDRELSVNPIKNFTFAVKKIGKLYPLHAATTTIQWGMMAWYYIKLFASMLSAGAVALVVLGFWPKYLLHMGLLHAWVPDESVNFLFNGPSWYLSVTVFLYFVFPWILKLIKAIKSRLGLILLGASTLLVMYVVALVSNLYCSEAFGIWIMAHCPLMKLGNFILGCILAKIYIEQRKESEDKTYSKLVWTLIELLVVAGLIGFEFLFRISKTFSINGIAIYDNYSFLGTVGFNAIALILVLLFILNRGYVTALLGNKVFIYLGDISAYTYLTHYIFTILWADLVQIYPIDNTGWIKFGAIMAEFTLTVASGALCYHLAKRKARKKKQKKLENRGVYEIN